LENKNNLRIAFGIVLLSLLLALALGALLVGGLSATTDLTTTDITLISMLISTFFIGVPVIIYLISKRIPLKSALRFNPISIKSVFAIILLSIGFIVIIDELDRIVYTLFGHPDYLEQLVEQLKLTSIFNGIIIVASTVLIAPFVEEMLFRGYLQKVLEDNWQDVTKAVLVTSLLFAFVHLNLYWVVQIYLLGLVLGYLAWRTNSILPSLILHALNNGFAVALNNAQDYFNEYYNWHEHVHPLWVICAIILVFTGFRILNHDLESQS
jgi:membrane protease YdiL (CAAX protease family)